jgi:pimeloyl-ACP methyl ester carboxylesterase
LPSGLGSALAATAAALAAAALYNSYRTRQVERRHPPAGRFIEIDGVRLHYLEQGAGTPVVLLKGMFAPLPVPERFEQGFPRGMPVRPLQIRAEAEDGAGMAREAAAMQDRYRELHLPVVIMAGSDDQVVDVGRHAIRLHQQIPHSELRLVPGAGHMVHHVVPGQAAEMIEAAANGHRIASGPELAATPPAVAHDRPAVATE